MFKACSHIFKKDVFLKVLLVDYLSARTSGLFAQACNLMHIIGGIVATAASCIFHQYAKTIEHILGSKKSPRKIS